MRQVKDAVGAYLQGNQCLAEPVRSSVSMMHAARPVSTSYKGCARIKMEAGNEQQRSHAKYLDLYVQGTSFLVIAHQSVRCIDISGESSWIVHAFRWRWSRQLMSSNVAIPSMAGCRLSALECCCSSLGQVQLASMIGPLGLCMQVVEAVLEQDRKSDLAKCVGL